MLTKIRRDDSGEFKEVQIKFSLISLYAIVKQFCFINSLMNQQCNIVHTHTHTTHTHL